MTLTTEQWLTVGVAACGVLVQFLIAYLGRRQVRKQLDLQHLVSHRSTASFIADKRQHWIDELRTEMAFHLALSQEIIWKWDGLRMGAAQRVESEAKDKDGIYAPARVDQIHQEEADKFSPENSKREREHHEGHIRIMFRLNPTEDLHIQLRQCLDNIRYVMNKMQGAKTLDANRECVSRMLALVGEAQTHTEAILKAEWQRVKQEVAYPEALMATISKPESKK